MASPLDEILSTGHSGGRGLGGLSVYSPGGSTAIKQPTRTRAPLPRPRQSGGGYGAAATAVSRLGAQKARDDEDGSGFPGLASLGNVLEGGLQVVDFGRRAAVLGVEEFATEVMGADINDDDERSNWDKLTDLSYSVRDLIDEDSMPSWMRSTLGFAGDVLLDPLTYLTAGVGGVAGRAGRVGYAAKARSFADDAIRMAVTEGADDIAVAGLRSQYDDVVRKIGRYGPGVVDDDDLLRGIGLQKQGLRFGRPFSPGKGMRIGGDTALGDALGDVARQSNKLFAKGRARFYDSKVGGTLQDWRTPQIIAKAQRVVRSGAPEGNMDIPVALAMTTYHDGVRMGQKAFHGQFAPAFDQLSKKLDSRSAVAATHEAEQVGTFTQWNEYFDQLGRQAKKQGISFDMRKNFVPHIVTPEGKKALRASDDLRKATGITIERLDDPSGVTMPRTWNADDPIHTIDGVEVDFGKGTIEDVNRALQPVLGVEKFFEDNMTKIVPNYLRRLSSDVGTLQGLGRVSEMFPDLVKRSDDPAGLAMIFQDVVDEAATGKANKEAISTLQARLSGTNKAAGGAAKEVSDALEGARSIMSDAAGEHLASVKSLRNSTKKKLTQIEKTERDLLKRRDKIVSTIDSELDDMTERIAKIEGELSTLRYQERSALEAVEGAGESIDLRQRAQERATYFSQKIRDLEALEREIKADRGLLDQVNLRLESNDLKQRLLQRRKSTAPTPRPLPTEGQGGMGTWLDSNATQGDSYMQLAGGDLVDPTEGGLRITDAERAWAESVDEETFLRRQISSAEKGIKNLRDPEPWEIEELTQDLNYAKERLGKVLSARRNESLVGEADRAAAAQINDANIEDLGLQSRTPTDPVTGETLREQQIKDDYLKRRTQAEMTAEQQVQREADEIARRAAGEAEAIEKSPLLTPAEKGQLTKAKKAQQETSTQIRELFETPEAQLFLDERGLVFGEVEAFRNPTARRRLLDEDVLTPPGQDPRVPGQLELQRRTAESRIAAMDVELAGGPQAGVRSRGNPDAAKALEKNIADTQGKIADTERTIEHLRTKDLGGYAPKVASGGVALPERTPYLTPEGELTVPGKVVRPQKGRSRAIEQQEKKLLRYQEELQDFETRLADLGEASEVPARKNRGALRTERLSLVEQLQQDTRQINRIKKETDPFTRKLIKLNERRMKADADVKRLTRQGTQRLSVPGTSQSHMDLQRVLQGLRNDELEALRRAGREQRDAGFHQAKALPEYNDEPLFVGGRVRLPKTEQEIKDDLRTLRTSGAKKNIPSEAKAVLDSTAMPFSYTDGSRNPIAIAQRVLNDTDTAIPYRTALVHMGAITDKEAAAHSALYQDLANALALLDEAKGTGTNALTQTATTTADTLKRTNNFLVRYAQVIDNGATPSDDLARRVLRPIVRKDIENLNAVIPRVANDPDFLDDEVKTILEVIEDAVQDMSRADSLKQKANTYKREMAPLSLPKKIAFRETQIDILEQEHLPMFTRTLKKHQARRRRAIARNDEHAIMNADRQIKKSRQTIQDTRESLERHKAELNELRTGGWDPLDIQGLNETLETLTTKEMTDAQAQQLGKFFDEEVITALREMAGAEEITMYDIRATILDEIRQTADDVGEVRQFKTERQGLTSVTGTSQELSDLVGASLGLTAWREYQQARQLFSEAFDALGIRRGTDISKEATVGYKISNQSFRSKEARRIITEMMEKRRGLSSRDFAVRDLKARRARLKSVDRGLGKTRPKSNIVDMTTDASGNRIPVRKEVKTQDLERLPANQVDPAASPQDKMRQQAKLQKQQPLEDIRDARLEVLDEATDPTLSDAYVNWREALFGDVMRQRKTSEIVRARGEQQSRGLMAGSEGGVVRPSGAITRDSSSSQQKVLQDQLDQYGQLRQGFDQMEEQAAGANERLRPMGEEAESRLAQSEPAAAALRDELDSIRGSSLTPEIDDTQARIQQQYDEKIGPKQEELEQLRVQQEAYEKGKERALAELDPQIAETRRDMRTLNEQVYGPQVNTAREAGPVGSTDQPLPEMSTSTELAIPEVDPNRLALPAAGETSGPANAGLDAKLQEAKDIARSTQKKQVGLEREMTGTAGVARDFEEIMAIDIGLDELGTAQVRQLLADATIADSKQKALERSASALEDQLSKARAGKYKEVSESVLLSTWEPMAAGLMRGLDEDVKFYAARELSNYFTRIDSALQDGRFWKGVQAYTNFFKTYATMRPDFHVRNAMSAMFMNSTDGVPLNYNGKALRAWKKFRGQEAGFLDGLRQSPDEVSFVKGFTNGQLADAFEVALGSGAGGQFAERGIGGLADGSKLTNNPLTRLSRKAGEYVEGPVRLAVALDAIKNKGMDKYDAFARVTRLHFDYAEVSKMDEYAKRMIPFWTFMSRNLPLQLTQAMGKPRWYAGFNSFKRNFSEEGDPLAPDYWASGGGFALRGKPPIISSILGSGDDQVWLTPDLAHNSLRQDMSAYSGLLSGQNPGEVLTSLNPLFTAPIEYITERDLFTGQQFDETDVQKLGGLEKVLEPLLALIGASEGGVAQEKYLNLGKSLLPPWDQASRIAPHVVQGEYPNEVKESLQRNTFARYLGLPVRQLTEEQKQATQRSNFFDQQQENDMQQAMQRALAGN